MNRIILLKKFSEKEENTDRQSNDIRKINVWTKWEVKKVMEIIKKTNFRFEEYNWT